MKVFIIKIVQENTSNSFESSLWSVKNDGIFKCLIWIACFSVEMYFKFV